MLAPGFPAIEFYPVDFPIMGEAQARSPRAQRYVLWGGLPAVVAVSGLFQVRDLDVWWRVRTGEWIWSHRSIPDTDPFSHTAEGAWNCVEPLGNLFLYGFHAAFGPAGLSWAGALLALAVALAAVALAHHVVDEGPHVGPIVLAMGLFASASNFRFGPKPEMFSLCGLAVLLLVLHAVEKRREWRLLLIVPLLVLVWAWLHRGSTVSLPVLGAAGLTWALRRDTRRLAWVSFGVLALTLGALLLAPGMAGSLASTASVVSTSAYVEHIGEWRPLTWGAVWSTMPALPVLTAIWLCVAPVQRRLHFGTLVVLGLGLMALRHARFAPLWALAMMPEVAWGLARVLHRRRDAVSQWVRPPVLGSLLIATAGSAIALAYANRPVTTWGPGVHDSLRPVRAAQFLAEHPPPGRMFNTFNYGSYLLYALGPQQKVFIDGRNDQLYRPEFFAQSAVTAANPKALSQLVESYDVTYAVLQCTKIVSLSYLWLYQNPDWWMVYLDDKAAILVKRTPESASYLEQHAYHELRPDTALGRANSPDLDPRHAEFAKEIMRHVAESPQSIRAHYLAALVHRRGGHQEAYLAEREQVRAMAAERRETILLP